MSRTTKTNKQVEFEKTHGKIAYRKRMIEEKEAEAEVASCLDAAYERLAMRQGLVRNPVFEENKRCFINCGGRCNCASKKIS